MIRNNMKLICAYFVFIIACYCQNPESSKIVASEALQSGQVKHAQIKILQATSSDENRENETPVNLRKVLDEIQDNSNISGQQSLNKSSTFFQTGNSSTFQNVTTINSSLRNQSMHTNSSFWTNTSIGNESMYANSTFWTNTSIGNESMYANSTFWTISSNSSNSTIQANKTLSLTQKQAEVIQRRPIPPKNQVSNLPPIPQKNTNLYCGRNHGIDFRNRRIERTQSRQRLVKTIYGFDMYVDSKDYTVSSAITSAGTWEPHYINLIGHIVQPGQSVLNLGSQSGLQALIMGKIVGPTGRLFIFQPYGFSNTLVTKNIELNGLQNITKIYKIGASDQKSKATIQVSYSNTGGSQIIPSQLARPLTTRNGRRVIPGINQQQEVQLDRVDQVLQKDVILHFALLDVQKMQVKALKGMKGIIERSPNLIIMTEWQFLRNPRRNKQETKQLLQYMIDRGYKIYSYHGGNFVTCELGKFREYKIIDQLLRIDFLDVFFIPKDMPLPS